MVSNVTIFLHFSSFYDFDVWFWNCSDSVVFFFSNFYLYPQKEQSPLTSNHWREKNTTVLPKALPRTPPQQSVMELTT
jgi:hypothetical protein